MLFWVLLVTCVLSQQYTQHGDDSGVCIDSNGVSPPNFSKNSVGPLSCQSQCNLEGLCIGYSHAPTLAGGVTNRCAIWIDRNEITDRAANFDDWEVHNYPGWVENVITLAGGDGANGWSCSTRVDVCAEGFLLAGGATINYPEIDQGAYVDIDCPSGYTGTVRVECQNGVAGKIGAGTCNPVEDITWTDMGVGVCRDHSITNTGTGIGPGVSPPNFSRNDLTEDECKTECIGNALTCNGIGYNDSIPRCALFINVDTAFCGNKQGWETHAYQFGWDANSSDITGTSNEAGWRCHKRTMGSQVDNYDRMAGTGVCANDSNDSPSNYSRNGMNETDCMNECTGYDQCLGFAHNLGASRCALYMNTHLQLAGLSDWEEHLGEPGWASDPQITKADGVGSSWLCYKKD